VIIGVGAISFQNSTSKFVMSYW